MSFIKNIHLLQRDFSEADISLMEHAALDHKRFSNILFKILDYDPGKKTVTFRAWQEKSMAKNYQPAKRLIEIVHETFDRFFTGYKIKVQPVAYKEPSCNQVTPAWLQSQMKKKGIKLKHIASDMGLDYPNLSLILNGEKEISQPMKAALYYYFVAKE